MGTGGEAWFTAGAGEDFLEELSGRLEGWGFSGQRLPATLPPPETCPSNRAWPQGHHFQDVCFDCPWHND